MERLTKKQSDGTYGALEGASAEKIVLKLARFEDMYDALRAEQSKIIADMGRMRADGKTKTVTYKQLIANKMMVAGLLSRFGVYGI